MVWPEEDSGRKEGLKGNSVATSHSSTFSRLFFQSFSYFPSPLDTHCSSLLERKDDHSPPTSGARDDRRAERDGDERGMSEDAQAPRPARRVPVALHTAEGIGEGWRGGGVRLVLVGPVKRGPRPGRAGQSWCHFHLRTRLIRPRSRAASLGAVHWPLRSPLPLREDCKEDVHVIGVILDVWGSATAR